MIPTNAPVLAFLAVFGALCLLPSIAILVGLLVIDRRVRGALADHRRADQERVDGLVRRLLTGRERRPMGFVLHEGDEQRRPRGDGSGGVVVWVVEPRED